MEQRKEEDAPIRGVSPWALAVARELKHPKLKVLAEFPIKDMLIKFKQTESALWVVADWCSIGGIAIRTTLSPEADLKVDDFNKTDNSLECTASALLGKYRVKIEILDADKPTIHFMYALTPAENLNIPFWPSDTYPIDADGNPLTTRGIVHAAQRGPAAGLLFMSLTEPECGSMLYLQDFTSLNDY